MKFSEKTADVLIFVGTLIWITTACAAIVGFFNVLAHHREGWFVPSIGLALGSEILRVSLGYFVWPSTSLHRDRNSVNINEAPQESKKDVD